MVKRSNLLQHEKEDVVNELADLRLLREIVVSGIDPQTINADLFCFLLQLKRGACDDGLEFSSEECQALISSIILELSPIVEEPSFSLDDCAFISGPIQN